MVGLPRWSGGVQFDSLSQQLLLGRSVIDSTHWEAHDPGERMTESANARPASKSPVRLLRTKLFVPQVHPELVARPRLFSLLDESRTQKLTLVAAPAGFGKTTLLSAWIAERDVDVGWVSLDERDSDPTRFWTYAIAALQTIWPSVGAVSSAMLQSSQAPPIEGVLTELLNEVAGQEGSALLILDDYHVIAEAGIHRGMSFLLSHLPPQLSIILLSREDPPLSLAVLRARRQLLEIRAPELRFTSAEAHIFFSRAMGLELRGQDLAALETVTEGWAAGLQLAALSLQEFEDVGAFVTSFSGSHRYVFDYLAYEILNRQPPDVYEFLLKTSLLTRMSGELCDAVVSRERSRAILERLDSTNLFIVPLDPERRWYRYHHLFAGFLRARLTAETTPTELADLHRRAGDWYAAHDALPDAIEHALASGDFAHAMALIKSEVYDMFSRSELRTLLAWVSELPQELLREDHLLSMAAAWAALAMGRMDELERRLDDVERSIDARPDGSPESFAREPETRGALGEIACLRASLAFNTMDFARVRELSDLARSYLGAGSVDSAVDMPGGLFNDRHSLLGVAAFNLAIAQMYNGETQAALQTFDEAIHLIRADENLHLLPMCISYLAQLQVQQGQLRAAARSYSEAVREIRGGHVRSPLSGGVYTGLGWVHYEWNELDRAADLLQQGIDLGTQWSHWEILLSGYAGLAHIDAARGAPVGAEGRLQELAGILERMNLQWAQPGVEAHRALLAVRQGDVATARAWAGTTSLPEDGPIPYPLEFYALVLVRILLAQGELERALNVLDRVSVEAESGGRVGRMIEAMAVRALLLDARGDRPAALAHLTQALEMADPEGYTRTFVDEGPAMQALLSELADRSRIAARILKAFDGPNEGATATSPPVGPSEVGTLPESLTDREQEVLALIAQGLTNQDIANHLVLSINTVKTHAKNIYEKLGVRNRAQATLRATELRLL